jgi:hypothetical protein
VDVPCVFFLKNMQKGVLSCGSVLILPIMGWASDDFAHMQMTQCVVSGSAVDHWQFESVHRLSIFFLL